MKSITQVVLPIALVAVVVFGITFIANYTNAPPAVSTRPAGPDGNSGTVGEPPLRFFATKISPSAPIGIEHYDTASIPDPARRFVEFAAAFRRGRFQPDYEIDQKGYFDYWFQNMHAQAAKVSLRTKNCQCAGVSLGIVPPSAWHDYIQKTAAANLPVLPIPSLLSPLAAAELAGKVQWQELSMESDSDRKIVPAADERFGPQIGMFRVSWSGTQEGPKTVTAEVLYGLGDAPPGFVTLEARSVIVPTVRVAAFPTGSAEVKFGDLLANASVTREVYCWSTTRRELELTVIMPTVDQDPCITWTKPRQLSESEIDGFVERSNMLATGAQRPRCAYQLLVTVRERCEIDKDGTKILHQMDLGPFEKRLRVSADSRNELLLALRGFVRGDVRIMSEGEAGDRIDFGRPFASSATQTKQVRLIADRPGIDFEVDEKAKSPSYLAVELLAGKPIQGKNTWTLRVTIPASKLAGTLPADAAIVLQTKDAAKRRIRIPVIAKTFDSGSPF